MPWSAADAHRHTHKASTDAEKERWATIANAVLQHTGDERLAIATADKAIARKKKKPAG